MTTWRAHSPTRRMRTAWKGKSVYTFPAHLYTHLHAFFTFLRSWLAASSIPVTILGGRDISLTT